MEHFWGNGGGCPCTHPGSPDCEGADLLPVAFHCKAKRMLVLWYAHKHVDLAVPAEGKTYHETHTLNPKSTH